MCQKIPAEVDYEGTRKLLQDDPSPLNVVLLQEIQRYNTLLHTIRFVLMWKTESQTKAELFKVIRIIAWCVRVCMCV